MLSERWCMYVSGRVQGVGYRMFVQKKARALGLKGFVRNLADGRVLAEAEGDPAKLETLRSAMMRGPKRSEVTAIDIENKQPLGTDNGFSIR